MQNQGTEQDVFEPCSEGQWYKRNKNIMANWAASTQSRSEPVVYSFQVVCMSEMLTQVIQKDHGCAEEALLCGSLLTTGLRKRLSVSRLTNARTRLSFSGVAKFWLDVQGGLHRCDSKGQWYPLVYIIFIEFLYPSHMVHGKLTQRCTLVVNLDSRAHRVADTTPICGDQVA